MVWRILEASQAVVGLATEPIQEFYVRPIASHRILNLICGLVSVMWNPFFAARMTGWWRPYGSGDLRQMSSLATETEINIFMIPHFNLLP